MLILDELSQVECFLIRNCIREAKLAYNTYLYFPVKDNIHLFTEEAKVIKREGDVHWIECDLLQHCRIRFDQELPFKWFSDNRIFFGFIENGYVIFNIKYIIDMFSILRFETF